MAASGDSAPTTASRLIPEATLAGRLWEGNDEAFGLRAPPWAFPSNFRYVIGNPTVVPSGPSYENCRTAGAAVFALGPRHPVSNGVGSAIDSAR